MKEVLKDIKKCSRCALCAEICPIFKIEKKECALTRGKFSQLYGVLIGDLNFSKKIKKNLEMCLNCGKCTKFCPTEIDTVKIFSKIKSKNLTKLDKILSSKKAFDLMFMPFKIFKKKAPQEFKGDIHFWGCVSKYKNEFTCCGLPYLVKGRLDLYEEAVKSNIELIEREDVKRVIFDCATCFDTVSKYPFKNPETIKKLVFEPEFKIPNKPFTFHTPCHLNKKVEEEIKEKLRRNKNYIEYESNSCCGFGGSFFLFHPIISSKLSLNKAIEIHKTGAKTALTVCPTCSWSLIWGKILYNILKFFKRV